MIYSRCPRSVMEMNDREALCLQMYSLHGFAGLSIGLWHEGSETLVFNERSRFPTTTVIMTYNICERKKYLHFRVWQIRYIHVGNISCLHMLTILLNSSCKPCKRQTWYIRKTLFYEQLAFWCRRMPQDCYGSLYERQNSLCNIVLSLLHPGDNSKLPKASLCNTA